MESPRLVLRTSGTEIVERSAELVHAANSLYALFALSIEILILGCSSVLVSLAFAHSTRATYGSPMLAMGSHTGDRPGDIFIFCFLFIRSCPGLRARTYYFLKEVIYGNESTANEEHVPVF
jgi:hypothetical protein